MIKLSKTIKKLFEDYPPPMNSKLHKGSKYIKKEIRVISHHFCMKYASFWMTIITNSSPNSK